MANFYFTPGLLIEWRANPWTLRRTIRDDDGTHYQFECLANGEIEKLSLTDFFREMKGGALKIVSGAVTESQVKIDHSGGDARQDISVFGEEQADRIVTKLKYVMDLRKAKISRGRIELYGKVIENTWLQLSREEERKAEGRREILRPSVNSVYDWRRKFEDSGETPAALLDGRAGHSGRKPLYTGDELTLARQAIDQTYMVLERGTVKDTHDTLITLVSRANNERPPDAAMIRCASERKVHGLIHEISAYERTEARYGKQRADMLFRSVEHAPDVSRPAEKYEIDHTWVNLFFLDDELMLPLGRPIFTAIRDKYSGMPVGYHLGFAGASLHATLSAMRDSLIPKGIRFENIENSWDEGGKPEEFGNDNGMEFHSQDWRRACSALPAHYEYNPVKMSWAKGGIENFVGRTNRDLCEKTPGTTFANILERDDYKSAQHAVVRFSVGHMLFDKWMVDIYARSPNRRKQARPVDLWHEGAVRAPIPYCDSLPNLSIALGQTAQGTVDNSGITIKYLTYNSPALNGLLRQHGSMRGRSGTAWKTRFHFNRSEIWHLWVPVPGENRYLEVPCVQWDYAYGMNAWTHEMIRKVAAIKLKKRVDIEALALAKEYVRQVVAEEISRRPAAIKKAYSRMADINSAKVLARQPATVTRLFHGQPKPATATPTAASAAEQKIIAPSFPQNLVVPRFESEVVPRERGS